MVIREDGQQQNSLFRETHSELFSQLNDGTVMNLQFVSVSTKDNLSRVLICCCCDVKVLTKLSILYDTYM